MAELPDLTIFAKILARKYHAQQLKTLTVTESRKLKISASALKSALEGSILAEVTREGKTLQFHFSGGIVLGLHLMLRGELVSLEDNVTPKFQILAFHFQNGAGFAVVDMLKQATPTLNPESSVVPDALSLDEKYFTGRLSKKRVPIKAVLMDQKVMRGIGNSYADEILYNASVSPMSAANAIPPKKVTAIFRSINSVLHKAIKDIGEANDDELKGELKDFMSVHNPKLKVTTKGEEIKRNKIGGRTTYYTDSQELYK